MLVLNYTERVTILQRFCLLRSERCGEKKLYQENAVLSDVNLTIQQG